MQRKYFSSGSHWESIVGYSRSVRIGDFIYISGTTATNEQGNIIGINNPYLQTVQIITNLRMALEGLGASLEDIVRTRIYVTDISNWKEIGKAHSEYFRHIRPATTMVEVSRLINSDILVEIEAEAVLSRCEESL